METEKAAGKVTDWDGGDLSASLIEREEQEEREAQEKKEAQALAEAEAEKEAKELEEARELDSENVRETDADGDSNGYGTTGQESGEETEEGASEVPEEEPEISEESTEEDAEGDKNTSGESEGAEEAPENESVGEDVGTFEMTAYVAFCDTGCTGITASGYDVSSTIYSPEGLRIVAADPGVLPFGTIIEITSGGNTFQAVVLDSGGDINGNRLDLLVESEAEALEYGRQDVDVRILGQ
ncbi:3D domain-containing protein [Oceanobacillus sojae]|uniref:3D domain-containing protein n=1 Tax=Oceanobacillus sojae TaxID=582851 RepID=UPI00362F7F5E